MCFPVSKCCFCIGLGAGTKIISIASLLSAAVTAVVYAGAAGATGSVPPGAHSKQCFYAMVAVVALCQMVVCSLLVYGAFWGKPSYLWPWLVTSWITCCSLVLLSLLGAVLLTIQYYEDVETFTNISTMSTFYFIYAVIVYYCASVVQSTRLEMLRAEGTESAYRLVRHQNITKTLVV